VLLFRVPSPRLLARFTFRSELHLPRFLALFATSLERSHFFAKAPTPSLRSVLRFSQPPDVFLRAPAHGLISSRCHVQGLARSGASLPVQPPSLIGRSCPRAVGPGATHPLAQVAITLGPRLRGLHPHEAAFEATQLFTTRPAAPLLGLLSSRPSLPAAGPSLPRTFHSRRCPSKPALARSPPKAVLSVSTASHSAAPSPCCRPARVFEPTLRISGPVTRTPCSCPHFMLARRAQRPVARSMCSSTLAPLGCPLDAPVHARTARLPARCVRQTLAPLGCPIDAPVRALQLPAPPGCPGDAIFRSTRSARSPRLPEECARRESAMRSPLGCPRDEYTSRRLRALVAQGTAPSPPRSHRPVTRATSARRAPEFVLRSRLPGCSARRVLSPSPALRLPFVTSTLRAPATYSPLGCPRDEPVSRVERLR